MARDRKKRRKPEVCWPDLCTSPDTWSYAEARGVAINPIVTGIGSHPRSISDEDWVLSCEQDIKEVGLEQFLTDLLHILRLTIPRYRGEPPPVGDYPRRQSKEEMPLPDVSFPGDRDWKDERRSERMLAGLICNPAYTGIPPYPPVIHKETWIAAGLRMVQEEGLRQYLVNVLYQLKKSIRALSS